MWCDENVGRSKMRIDATKTASHGGAVNVSSIAARLAAPFCDPGSLKYRKINPDYTRSKKCRLDVRETTRISASDAQVVSGALTETEEVRVARFPNPAFLFYLSAGDCLSIHRPTRD
jgi:ubiquitin conjugation factor E4 B